jgi:hypothetical protein
MDKVQKHNSFNTNTPSSDPTEIIYAVLHYFPLISLSVIHSDFMPYASFAQSSFT